MVMGKNITWEKGKMKHEYPSPYNIEAIVKKVNLKKGN